MTDDLQKKVDRAVRLLQTVAKGYDGEIELGYSGGKDSDVILHLARRAGIRVKPIYRNTTNKKDCRHASVGSAARS